MGERTQNVTIAGLLIFMCSICWGSGLEYGRHQMKRWQDSYYSEHMKEIRPDCIVPYKVHVEKGTNALYWVCETYPVADANEAFKEGAKLGYQMALIGHGCEFCTPPIAPAPPKKAKPAKASKHVYWEWGATGTTITLPAELEIYCDSSVPPGDGWLPLTSAPHDGTIVEIAETYGYTPWYDFYQFVDGGWKQASNHAYGLNGEKCGYWRPRRTATIRSDN